MHTVNHCDVIGCPDCREDDERNDRQRAIEAADEEVAKAVANMPSWIDGFIERDGDRVTLNLELVSDGVPEDQRGLDLASSLERAAAELRRVAYINQGIRLAS